MSVTNELLHSKLAMQMYALGAQSGTNELYHSWAATTNTNASMAKHSTAVTALKQLLLALPEVQTIIMRTFIYLTVLLTLVGLCQEVVRKQ